MKWECDPDKAPVNVTLIGAYNKRSLATTTKGV